MKVRSEEAQTGVDTPPQLKLAGDL